MEQDFSSRFGGKFPRATQHVKSSSCFSTQNVPNRMFHFFKANFDTSLRLSWLFFGECNRLVQMVNEILGWNLPCLPLICLNCELTCLPMYNDKQPWNTVQAVKNKTNLMCVARKQSSCKVGCSGLVTVIFTKRCNKPCWSNLLGKISDGGFCLKKLSYFGKGSITIALLMAPKFYS